VSTLFTTLANMN